MLERVWRKGNPPTLLVGMVQPLWETVWRYHRKLDIKLLYVPSIPLLGIYLDKTFIQKDTCTPIFITALFTIAETRKQTKCPSTDKRIKMWYIYAMEYHSSIKKNKIMPFAATWMELKILILSKSERERKFHMISLICGIKYMA